MKDKYEKVILGVAVLIAIAMIVLGVLKLGAVEEDFPVPGENPKTARPIESDGVITQNVQWLSKPLVLGPEETDKGRKVDTFTGPNIYVRRGEKGTVDPDAPGEKPIHAPIDNNWWAENGLSDVMGYGDAPQQDSDDDGFSNMEEYNEKTLPNDKNSFPSLFAKVKVASIESNGWKLRFSDYGGGKLSFKVEGIAEVNGKRMKVTNRMAGEAAAPGDIFFEKEPYKGRFKFVEAVQKEVRSMEKTFAMVEDLKPGKGNRVYEIAPGTPKVIYKDYTARLYLDTPALRNEKFEVEEGMTFALPFDAKAAEKPYTLKEIGEDGKTALLLWDNNGETKELQLRLEN